MIYIQPSDFIPLNYQAFDGNDTLYVRAFMLDQFGVQIGSACLLSHSAGGNYAGAVQMPERTWISIIYEAFNDSGYLDKSSIYPSSTEVFGAMAPGSQIPLIVQAPDGNSNLFIRSNVTDSAGNPISGSPFNLIHRGRGQYSVASATMPDSGWIKVQSEVFEDSGYTTRSNVYGSSSEIYTVSGGGGSGITIVENRFTRTNMKINGYSPRERYQITRGDQVTLRFIAETDTGAFDLAGWTLETHFAGIRRDDVIIPNSQHAVINSQGYFDVTLTASDSAALGLGRRLSVMTKATKGDSIIHFHTIRFLTVLNSSVEEN